MSPAQVISKIKVFFERIIKLKIYWTHSRFIPYLIHPSSCLFQWVQKFGQQNVKRENNQELQQRQANY